MEWEWVQNQKFMEKAGISGIFYEIWLSLRKDNSMSRALQDLRTHTSHIEMVGFWDQQSDKFEGF